MAMASNSLAPMRRFKISSRPTLVSKVHLPFCFTIGIGTGKSSLPTVRMARFGFFESIPSLFFSFALAANATARFLSATGSSELRISLLSGPRISVKAATSNDSAAWMRLSVASFGVLNCFCLDLEAAVAFCLVFSGAACNANPAEPNKTIAQATKEIFNGFMMLDLDFIGCGSISELFISGVPLRRHDRHRRDHHRHG